MPVSRQGRFGSLAATSLMVGLGGIQPAAAQSAARDEPPEIGEIVVTAQKREQSLQDVPISITAVGAEELQRRGVQSASDVAKNVPGLKLQAIFGDSTNPNFFLRGIGLLDFGDVAETPVGFYQDEVYLATQASQGLQLFDVERVEVLKGPQGTLYGRNTTGGVINIVTAEPGTTFGGQASAQVGSFGQTIVEAAAGGPVADNVGARLAVKINRDNGFQRSDTTGIDGFGQTNSLAIRGKLKFDLGAGSDLLLTGAYSRADQRSPLYPLFGLLEADLTTLCSQERAATGACFNQIGERFINNPRRGLSEDTDPRSQLDQYGATARLRVALGGSTTLTSVTSYQDVDKSYEDDADASSIPLLSSVYGLKARQWSQELRLDGTLPRGTWVVGAFAFDERRRSLTSAPLVADALGLPFYGSTGDQKTRAYAAFAQIDYDLVDRLTVTAGARYSDESKSIVVEAPGFFAPEPSRLQADRVTGKIGLAWKPDTDTLVYASVSTGFKAGGFNATFVTNPDTVRPVGDETITAYELGTKVDLLGRRVRLNLAAFYYDYRDVQAVSLDPSLQPVPGSRLQTLGDARIYGLDGELTFQPSSALSATVGFGLLDTQIRSDRFGGTIYGNGLVPFDRNDLPLAPNLSLNSVVRYYIPLRAGSRLMLQADANYRSSVSFTATGSRQPINAYHGYALAGLRAGWFSADESLSVEAFVDNLFDEKYLVFRSITSGDTATGAWGRPRTFGIRVGTRF